MYVLTKKDCKRLIVRRKTIIQTKQTINDSSFYDLRLKKTFVELTPERAHKIEPCGRKPEKNGKMIKN